jgi:hypothetical protein
MKNKERQLEDVSLPLPMGWLPHSNHCSDSWQEEGFPRLLSDGDSPGLGRPEVAQIHPNLQIPPGCEMTGKKRQILLKSGERESEFKGFATDKV